MKGRSRLLLLFLIYCAALAAVLFYRSSDGMGFGFNYAAERLNTSANLIPFETMIRYHRAYTAGSVSFVTYFFNVYGNLLLFLPMGVFLGKITGKKMLCLFTVLLITLSAELIQLYFGVGRFDVDDVILNLTGAFIPLLFIKKLR